MHRGLNLNAYSEKKCVIVERVQGSLQSLFYKKMEYSNTHQWTRFIEQVKNIYIHRRHRTIKMSPFEAEMAHNQSKVLKALHVHYAKYRRSLPKFKVGQSVRISRIKGIFNRGYLQSFNDEIFFVNKVLNNLPVPRYELREYDGNIIKSGVFWPNELVAFNITPNYQYRVEKVIKKEGQKLFVKWRGWPEKYNSWISIRDVKNI